MVDLRPGDVLLHSRAFTEADGRLFSELSGDFNAIHRSPAPPSSPFPRPVLHGLLSASLFSTVFAQHLPGSIYLSQSLRFCAPAFYDEALQVRVQVQTVTMKGRKREKGREEVGKERGVDRGSGEEAASTVREGRAVVECSTVISRGDVVLIDGTATVLVPRVRFDG